MEIVQNMWTSTAFDSGSQNGFGSDKKNYLLMHAMGPNVAGVIGTAVAAGMFISVLK